MEGAGGAVEGAGGAVEGPGGRGAGAAGPAEELEGWLRVARAVERPHLGPEGWERGGLAAGGAGAAAWEALRGRLREPVPPERAVARFPAGGGAEQEGASREAVARCEAEGVPCLLDGAMETGWDLEELAYESLLARFGEVPWRLSDVHGELLTLLEFDEYVGTTRDDAPLGIYESQFHRDPTGIISNWYSSPQTHGGEPLFSSDLFALSRSWRRPPWRWVLIGAERSGTGMHVDPIYTSAWVALVAGLKRWVMFPPDTEPVGEHGGPAGPREAPLARDSEPQLEAVHWFMEHYAAVGSPEWPGAPPVEILQRPGEVVYVPQGWHHIVVNLETSVAVTHNWASELGQFELMWRETCRDEPHFARAFFRALRRERPDLARRAIAAAVPPGGLPPWDAAPSPDSSEPSSPADSSDSDSSDSPRAK